MVADHPYDFWQVYKDPEKYKFYKTDQRYLNYMICVSIDDPRLKESK
jgi:hypothetical protein